jgi:hypothetical protein
MLRFFQEQEGRVDRLLRIIDAPDQQAQIGGLVFEDILIFAFQNMWHLRDWALNDPQFGALDRRALRDEIETNAYLRVCADLANGSKHFSLNNPRTTIAQSDQRGMYCDSGKGIFQVLYYLESTDPSSPFHGMEVRQFLGECRQEWRRIIDRHYLSDVMGFLDAT